MDEQKKWVKEGGYVLYLRNGAVQHLSIVFSFVLLAISGGLLVKIPASSTGAKYISKDAIWDFLFFQGYVKVYAPLVISNTTLTARGLLNLLNFKRTSIHEAKFVLVYIS